MTFCTVEVVEGIFLSIPYYSVVVHYNIHIVVVEIYHVQRHAAHMHYFVVVSYADFSFLLPMNDGHHYLAGVFYETWYYYY